MIGNKEFCFGQAIKCYLRIWNGGEGGSTSCPTQLEQPTMYFIQQTFILKIFLQISRDGIGSFQALPHLETLNNTKS